MPFTIADECLILTFFERSSSSGPPTRRVFMKQLEEAVALEIVRHREERVRAGNAQELARLLGAARARSLGLAEHEEGRCLRPIELRDGGDDVLVPVQDQQEVRFVDLLVDA